MDLTKERRIETGAFYTPRIWAAKAVEYIREIVPNMEDYIFMDVCCGEGSLLEALPKECAKFGTTLEWEDVEICRNKGLFVWQLDFLNESVSDLLRPDQMDRLIVFTNPPYYKLGVNHDCFAKRKFLAEGSAETGVSLNTTSNYFSIFRQAAIKYESWADSKIGGNGDIVEMDETHIYSCKYSRGRVLKGQKYWVLGAISRDTKRAKLFVTTKRSMPVINRFTHDNVVEGTHIMTDEWRGYNEQENN